MVSYKAIKKLSRCYCMWNEKGNCLQYCQSYSIVNLGKYWTKSYGMLATEIWH